MAHTSHARLWARLHALKTRDEVWASSSCWLSSSAPPSPAAAPRTSRRPPSSSTTRRCLQNSCYSRRTRAIAHSLLLGLLSGRRCGNRRRARRRPTTTILARRALLLCLCCSCVSYACAGAALFAHAAPAAQPAAGGHFRRDDDHVQGDRVQQRDTTAAIRTVDAVRVLGPRLRRRSAGRRHAHERHGARRRQRRGRPWVQQHEEGGQHREQAPAASDGARWRRLASAGCAPSSCASRCRMHVPSVVRQPFHTNVHPDGPVGLGGCAPRRRLFSTA